MVNLTIDGKSTSVPKGTTILEAARQLDIHIPTLCWLKKISTTGACRICAVEIEGVERPMTACNTPVKEGIQVTTQSPALTKTRKQIMELILLNHPLDCPVCDAGGECHLQDTCYELGVNRQEFKAEDVNPEAIDRWPLIQQVPSRCILCEKCTKVCHELIGADALFVNDKGDRAFIDKRVENCVYCGNCVAACPTGTMISKPFKFKARPWELKKTASICTLCPSHCEIDIQVKNNQVYRFTSNDDTTHNQGTLCIGGFFGHDYINSKKRLTTPQVGREKASWNEALNRVVTEIERVKEQHGALAVAGLSSPRLSNEENYLFQKLFRAAIGSNNIDTEARFGALRGLRALNKGLGLCGASNRVEVIGKADAILVFGADPSAEAPLVDWQIQNAVRRGDGQLILATMRHTHLTQFASSHLTYLPGSEIALAKGLARLLLDRGLLDDAELARTVTNIDELKADLADVDLNAIAATTGLSPASLEQAADILGTAKNVVIILGADILKSSYGISKSAVIANLAVLSGALTPQGGIFPLDDKGNSQGVLDLGVYPESLPGYQAYATSKAKFEKAWNCQLPGRGLDAEGILQEIEAGKIKFLYLAATNPATFANSSRWLKALAKLETLVVQDIFPNAVTELATVILPGTTFAEKNASYTSLDHQVRKTTRALASVGDSRADGEIFSELIGRLTATATGYDQNAILEEIRGLTDLYADADFNTRQWNALGSLPYEVPEQSLKYQLITVSDHADGLQLLLGKSMSHFGTTTTFATAVAEVEGTGLLQISPGDADQAGVKNGDTVQLTSSSGTLTGQIAISPRLPQGIVFAPVHFPALGAAALIPDGDNRIAVSLTKV